MKKMFVLLSSIICFLTASNADAYQQYSDQCVGQCADPCVGQCGSSCGRFYVGAFGGANWLHIRRIEGLHLKGKTGFTGALSLGYKFDNGFRVEGEVAYRRNKLGSHIEHAYNQKARLNAKLHSWSYMANFLYDFESVSCYLPNVVPYVGFGLGYTQTTVKANAHVKNYAYSHKASHKHSDNGFAYQGIAGIGYNLTESTTLAVEYRYFRGDKHVVDNSVGLALRHAF